MPPTGGGGAWKEQTGRLRLEGKPRRSRSKKFGLTKLFTLEVLPMAKLHDYIVKEPVTDGFFSVKSGQ